MYLPHIQSMLILNVMSQGFIVTVSGWVAGQLCVVADSPRTITALLPSSHSFAIQEYVRISEEEHQVVEHANSKLPNPGWVRIKYGKYKGNIGYIFDSDQSNGLISILIAFWDFPHPMPGGSVALLDQCLLPNDQAVHDILHDGKDMPFIRKTLRFCRDYCRRNSLKGPYLGLEGHIIQISNDMFHIYQAVSKEEVLVLRYYLDRCPLHQIFHPQLSMQQCFEPPPQSKSIQVGDHIEVLVGEHFKKCGIVEWFPTGSTMLWFRDMDPMLSGDDVGTSVGLLRIQVPIAVIQWTKLPDTFKYTQGRGYNVRPGDVINIPIRFMIKVCNAKLDSLDNIIGQVFIVGGDWKGY
ncbi:uncharacterized protein BJ212DRAFT_1297457 [Suillus subaureus]|uniref:Uncharacterized protein n=1 Tax=Suillus subaureus TaxID=48587 RepID=A0A9P7EGG8_9AGAM|nr:uncharacterized protein BJ212DRAFT_1297457 [Suillus subaureus]KAG1820995.1 hypothetical protein BJ212DRAFT_1297457 [Suillus subaureus]